MFAPIRQTLRSLGRAPGLAAAAIATIALGAAFTTAMVAVVDGILFRPLPFREPERVVALRDVETQTSTRAGLSAPNFEDLARNAKTIDAVALWIAESAALTGEGVPERVSSIRVSPSIFAALGVRTVVGQPFATDDSIVLTHAFWQSRFAGSPTVVGRTLRLDGKPYTIAGVLPPELKYPRGDAAIWQPLVFRSYETENREKRMFRAVARLAPGTTIAQASAEIGVLSRTLARQHPEENRAWTTEVVPARDAVAPDAKPFWMLFAAAGLLLLLACANVANLLLARATALQSDSTIRAALGATRFDLSMLSLRESAVLATAGTILGVLLASWMVRAVVAFGPAALPAWSNLTIDLRVLAASAGMLILTTLLAGTAPAIVLSREATDPLREHGRISSRHGGRLRRILTGLQVALAVVLLVGALLLVRSVAALENVDPGFAANGRIAATLYLPDHPYGRQPLREIQLHNQLFDRLRATPGVVSAGGVSSLPLNREGLDYETEVYIDGWVSEKPPEIDLRLASPDYFKTIDVPLVNGRDFTASDDPRGAKVAIVNEAFVRMFAATRDPLGINVKVYCDQCDAFRIVGVVADTRHDGLDRAVLPEIYVPVAQLPHGEITIVARVNGDPAPVIAAMRRELMRLDPNLALASISTLDDIVSRSVAGRRFNSRMLAAFSLCALFLAAIGLYGSLSFSIGQRQREIAVRMALGAQARDLWRLVASEASSPVIAGIVAGILASAGASRLLRTMIFGVTPADPVSYGVVLGSFAVIIALVTTAGFRRAASADVRELLSDS